MDLPNLYFKDFPIDFKQINPEDFPDFDVQNKTYISPDKQGYINEQLQSSIDLEEKNTVVVNAAVGQGKTYSIIEIVKKYYEAEEEYIIFIASPFVSLVEQYFNKIKETGISESKIFRYEMLGQKHIPNYLEKEIHIVTANCLLGNPGDDAFINSEIKREYLTKLSDFCKKEKKKVVFIYDEIHDAIHNFKEKYIFNLWKWKEVIQKNFIISATYNEASKIVIEYLAELTDDKIQIVESERVRFPEKQSELYLHYNPANNFKYNNQDIVNIFEDLIRRGKEIDVLSYSKTLAEAIIENKEEGIGKVLYKKYGEINNCTSELITNQRTSRVTPQNRYNPNMCNVGTNFKTGVSIEKDNHAFVIILPPIGAKMPFQNLYGIFSNGINSIIQALARQRKKGEIHIILPPPDKFDYSTLPFENTEIFCNWYNAVAHYKEPEKYVKYIPNYQQLEYLWDFYNNELRANLAKEIKLSESKERRGKVRLLFPEFKLFILEDGEDYLANRIPFLGGDLSAYITYCAFTNQFINCNLVSVTAKTTLFFEKGRIQSQLQKYYQMYFEDAHNSVYIYLNDPLFYKSFRDDLFNFFEIRLKADSKSHNIVPNGTSSYSILFENQLFGFVQRMITPYYSELFHKDKKLIDGEYSRKEYLLDCISQARYIDLNKKEYSKDFKEKIESFKFLDELRKRVARAREKNSVKKKGNFYFLPNKPIKNFLKDSEKVKFEKTLKYFTENDFILSSNFFDLKKGFKGKTYEKQKERIYKIILEDFFETKDYKLSTGSRKNGKEMLFVCKIPQYKKVANWVPPQIITFQNIFLSNFKD